MHYGLLKQGFKKKDIQRYLKEQRQWVEKDDLDEYSSLPSQTPGGVNPEGLCETLSPAYNKGSAIAPLRNDLRMIQREIYDLDRINASPQEDLTPKPNTIILKDLKTRHQGHRAASDASATNYHAPRQSSLLRFSSNVSSDNDCREDQSSHASFRVRPQIVYRPRSETYSYEQSEMDNGDSSSSSLATVFQDLIIDESLVPVKSVPSKASTLCGGIEELIPQKLPPSNMREIGAPTPIEEQSLLSFDGLGLDFSPADTRRIRPTLQTQNSTYSEQQPHTVQSSSPLPITHLPTTRDLQYSPSPILPSFPSTPARNPGGANVQTEPRRNRPRFTDGTSFTPYNDSIPAAEQPQTPADLARRPLVHELNVMYTAPPGRLRNDRLSPLSEHGNEIVAGQDSPTNRAISMRQRRNREYARSARVEGLRLNRLRRRFQAERNGDQGRVRGPGGPDFARLEAEHLDMWRDDLDADRVGEENFEDGITLDDMPRPGMRVVSGNRRVWDI